MFDRLIVQLAEVAHSLASFARLWQAGLLGCLSGDLRRRLAAHHAVVAVVVEGDQANVGLERGELRTPIGRIKLLEPASLSDALAPFRKLKPTVLLKLPPEAVITRRVSLPVQVRKQLHNALVFEIDRLTPFQSNQVFFEYRLPEPEARANKLLVELVVCLREQVTPWTARLRAEGVVPEVVAWEGAWPGANLLPLGDRRSAQGVGHQRVRLTLVAVFLLGLAVVISPLWQKQQQIASLTATVAALRPKAEKAAGLRKELEETRKQVELAANQKNREPRLVDLLQALTERLPDDTYVQNLEYTRGATQLRGESRKATALIGALEEAPGIDGVSFQSPVVQVPNTDKERFHISFQYTRAEGQ